MALVTTRAVLLRSYPYSESSQVLRFYTESHGAIGAMGRGVRAGTGKTGSSLDTFADGTLSVHMKPTRDLQTLKEFVASQPRRALGSDVRRFGGASVLAELVLRHALEEPSPPLFHALADGLDRLETASGDAVVPTVLQQGWRLVSTLGYRPILDACIECGSPLGDELARFDLAAGGLRCTRCSGAHGGPRLGPGARAQLEALLEHDEPPPLDRARSHLRLFSDFITHHLGLGRPLPSLQVLVDMVGDPSLAEPSPTAGGPRA
ncbi:MAG: DNA repair protein RecO [Gemmatimonadetes bacterium]|nr:DNA repair protein RecO [Gemmatimonadota bacterium]